MTESDRILSLFFDGIERKAQMSILSTRLHSKSLLNELIQAKMQAKANDQTAAAAYVQSKAADTGTGIEPGHVYVVRVYQYKARKHQVRFLGRSIRTKKVALTNLASAYAFTYEEAAEIIAETGSVEGKQFTIMLLAEATEREAIRANKK